MQENTEEGKYAHFCIKVTDKRLIVMKAGVSTVVN